MEAILRGRGLNDPESVRKFLEPSLNDLHDPSLLLGLDEAVACIERVIEVGESVYVFGDYDVDGIASAAMAYRFLRELGVEALVRVPNRQTDEYGLSDAAVAEADGLGAGLILSVDSGTTAHSAACAARERGVSLIVADHHLPEETLPPAEAIVNPHLAGSQYPFRDLASAGVVMKIIEGVARRRRKNGLEAPAPSSYMDLAALGTIADNVSMLGENRILARFGIEQMRESPRPALLALMEVARLTPRNLTGGDIAFQIVPRLNAAGRLDDAGISLSLLLESTQDGCRRAAAELESLNERRKQLVDLVVQEASAAAQTHRLEYPDAPLVLAGEGWHPGVLGIAAARIAEKYRVPAILLAQEGPICRGSGRSIGDWDLLELIRAASEALRTHGGHRSAVGLTLACEHLDRFRTMVVAKAKTDPSLQRSPGERVEVDARVRLDQLNAEFFESLRKLEPFGRGNPDPILAVRGRVKGQVRVFKDRHLRFDLAEGSSRQECIGFNLAEKLPTIRHSVERNADLHIAGTVLRTTFRGEERAQLSVREIAVEDPFRHG